MRSAPQLLTPRLFSFYSGRFSENAAPSLGLGSSAILPSLLVSDPFHKTLNAAIVDFYIHGDGGLSVNVHFIFCVGPPSV